MLLPYFRRDKVLGPAFELGQDTDYSHDYPQFLHLGAWIVP
jgi:hypothetical protein